MGEGRGLESSLAISEPLSSQGQSLLSQLAARIKRLCGEGGGSLWFATKKVSVSLGAAGWNTPPLVSQRAFLTTGLHVIHMAYRICSPRIVRLRDLLHWTLWGVRIWTAQWPSTVLPVEN